MINEKFKQRFSIAHWDAQKNGERSAFVKTFLNSSQDFQDEIADIYFGGEFLYKYEGQNKRFGDTMGVSPSPSHLKDLFDLQEKTGVQISLTLNQTIANLEVVGNKEIRNDFLKFLSTYYNAGLRSCTISDTHLMTSGILQEAFPDMVWKNTVNHQIKTAQEVVDYISLGYNTILVDRSLNKNLDELKKMYAVAKTRGAKISLLASEKCMPYCPFKTAHDNIQYRCQQEKWNPTQKKITTDGSTYWGTFSGLSCERWGRIDSTEGWEYSDSGSSMPRRSGSMFAITKEIFDEILDSTHILKFSGRLLSGLSSRDQMALAQEPKLERCFVYAYAHRSGLISPSLNKQIFAPSFSDIYEKNLSPFHSWGMFPLNLSERGNIDEKFFEDSQKAHSECFQTSVLSTKKAKAFEKIFINCKGQCYDCHACEKIYGLEPFDSLLDLRKPTGWIKSADGE